MIDCLRQTFVSPLLVGLLFWNFSGCGAAWALTPAADLLARPQWPTLLSYTYSETPAFEWQSAVTTFSSDTPAGLAFRIQNTPGVTSANDLAAGVLRTAGAVALPVLGIVLIATSVLWGAAAGLIYLILSGGNLDWAFSIGVGTTIVAAVTGVVLIILGLSIPSLGTTPNPSLNSGLAFKLTPYHF